MEVKLLACTKPIGSDGSFDLNESLNFSAKMAGICYVQDNFEKILNEPEENTKKRLNRVLYSGHHSVFDHVKLTFEFSKIPKILAMILNNEKDYSTSEKSARFTKFENLPGNEGILYDKWVNKLIPIIQEKYPMLYNEKAKDPILKIRKLAQENARYFVSIFTPTTDMGYTVSLRQLNYIIYMIEDYINNCSNCSNCSFNEKLIPYLKEFILLLEDYRVDGLIPKGKCRRLSLFGEEEYRDIKDIYSYVYQTSFKATYSCMAQNHRHRSESCFLYILDKFEFYVPEIIEDNESLKEEWLNDANSISSIYPQGTLIKVVQTGNLDTLLLKARERVCGQAQLEIMRHQVNIINNFIKNSEYGYILEEKTNNQTAKCMYKGSTCSSPCPFGSKQFERKI